MSIEAIRSLEGDLPEELLRESREEGFAFLDRLVDEWRSGKNRFERPGEALFAVREGASVVAICGLNVDPYQADPRVARLRHMYVLRAARRRGVGRFLVRHVLEHATAADFDKVRLRTDTREAGRFYEALGFRPCPHGRSATHELACSVNPGRAS